MSEFAAISLVYERFPASVRGAVIVRGMDADPHQVTVEDVRALEAADPSRSARSIGFERATVDVVPRGEVVVPFDVPFGALDPGWYRIEAEALVDGQHRIRTPVDDKRFHVPWPPEEVRRGQIRVGRDLAVAGAKVTIDRVECKGDRAVVRWRADGDVELRVLAGRHRVPVLERPGAEPPAERSTVTYPLLKAYRALTFEVTAGSGGSGSVTLEPG